MPRSRSLYLLAALVLVLLAGLWLATHPSEPPPGPGRLLFGRWQVRNVLVAVGLLWWAGAALCARSGRSAAVHYVVLSASLGICWLALEAVGFAGWISWPAVLGNEESESMGIRRVPDLDVDGLAREDLAEHWGIPRPPIPFHFRTDSNGFRNEPDREDADIVCLGDSFLVDGLVPHGDLVSARLESILDRTVQSIALLGIGPPEEEELLEEIRPPLDGRLLLHFVFEGNDLLDSAGWRALQEAKASGAPAAPAVPWTQRTLANQVVLLLQRWTDPEPAFLRHRRGWIDDEAYYFQWLRPSFEGFEAEIPRTVETLARIRRSVETAGGSYAVVLIPSKIRVLGAFCRFEEGSEIADWQAHCGPLPEALGRWSAEASVPLVDLTEPLRDAARTGSIPWFPADTHWNSVGHRVAAEALAASEHVRDWLASR